MKQTLKLLKRSEIPVAYQWKLSDIYPSTTAWEADFQKLKELLPKFGTINFLENGTTLLQVLQLKDELGRLLDRLFVFARMHKDEDNSAAEYQALASRIQSLATEVSSVTSFIVPQLVSLAPERRAEMIAAVPELQLYQRFFAEIDRQREHVLTEAEERLLAEAGELAEASSTIFGMLDNADLKFPSIQNEHGEEVELTKGRYRIFLESKERRVRHDAFLALYQTYQKFRNTFAATLDASVKTEVFYARNRRFNSALEASLDNDNIPVAVYDALIETVHQFLPALNNYQKLRKKLLQLDELHLYDLYTPLINEVDEDYPYEKAQEIVVKGLAPLGEEYLQQVRQAYTDGWIDVYENEGKTSGAYAWGAYDVHPYILLNYQNKQNDVFTLAHELGHAMHSFYSNQHQPYVYAGYRIFVAEVASTVNEALLMEHLLANSTDPNERKSLINHYLEEFRGTVFRQTMFAEFEKLIHAEVEQGGALTADWFSEKYLELNQRYYGQETVIDPEIAMEWARIPHFYSGFYVYKYATGYSAAIALSQQLLKEGAPARERYLKFLQSGDVADPLELLRLAGVDMASPEPIKAALQVFERLVNELAELSGVTL